MRHEQATEELRRLVHETVLEVSAEVLHGRETEKAYAPIGQDYREALARAIADRVAATHRPDRPTSYVWPEEGTDGP